MTEWRAVPDWEGYYEVSDAGQVRSLDGVMRAPNNTVRPLKGRILRPFPHPQFGYLQIDLKRDGRRWSTKVHRLVLLAFVGPPPEGCEGCHNNGDPADNRLSNLRWDTTAGNVRDQVRHGTHYFANKTTCPQGHPYSPENTRVNASGSRECRACHRARDRRRRAGEGNVA